MPFIITALSAVVAFALPDGTGGAAEKLHWTGTLDVGAVRYAVSCECLLDPTGGVLEAKADVRAPGGPEFSACSVKAVPLPQAELAGMKNFSSAFFPVLTTFRDLTEEGLRSNGYKKVSGSGTSSSDWWESTNTVQLLDDLPVKVRLFVENSGSGPGYSRGRIPRITVFSLGEWNNRLNDNAVLRLKRVEGFER